MLIVCVGEVEKVWVLDNGVNDYVIKLFGIQELMVCVWVLLCLCMVFGDGVFLYFDDGYLYIDLVCCEVYLDGVLVVLMCKEYVLLLLLLCNVGCVVIQFQILVEIWGFIYQYDMYYLCILVGKLCYKLGDFVLDLCYLFIELGVGLWFKG